MSMRILPAIAVFSDGSKLKSLFLLIGGGGPFPLAALLSPAELQ
jgi:hypothetical protein